MIGAIAGDIIGSVYENQPIKTVKFPLFGQGNRFTDDTVLTVAVADAILNRKSYAPTFRQYYEKYPRAGYGSRFAAWAQSWDNKPNDSFGNGSAMRVSPVGWAFDSLDRVLQEAEHSARPTHRHPEGIKGAQAVAAAIFLARQGSTRNAIRAYVEKTFKYDLSEPLDALRKHYEFDPTCQGTVPPAMIAFLESTDYEDAARKAVSLGGDSDTLACITGGIAEAFYGGVPNRIADEALAQLPSAFRDVVTRFNRKCRM